MFVIAIDSKPCKKRNTTKEKRNNLSSMLSWLFTVNALSFDDCSLLGMHLLKRPVDALSMKKLSVVTIFSTEDFSIYCWPTTWIGLWLNQKTEMRARAVSWNMQRRYFFNLKFQLSVYIDAKRSNQLGENLYEFISCKASSLKLVWLFSFHWNL